MQKVEGFWQKAKEEDGLLDRLSDFADKEGVSDQSDHQRRV